MNSKLCFDGFFQVLQIEAEGHLFDIIELKGDAVSVIAKTDEEHFVVNYEWRPAAQKNLLATTGGIINPGESPLEAAKRELLEETGYLADNYQLLNTCYPFPGITGQKINFVLATNAKRVQDPMLERGEKIDTKIIETNELESKMKNSSDVDGVFLTGYCLYRFKGL